MGLEPTRTGLSDQYVCHCITSEQADADEESRTLNLLNPAPESVCDRYIGALENNYADGRIRTITVQFLKLPPPAVGLHPRDFFY